jgi:hypothetical protein
MVGIKGFGLSGLSMLSKKKDPLSSPPSSGSKGVYNLSYDSIVDSHNAVMAGKIIDRLFIAINDGINRDGNRTSRTMKDLFLTDDTKLGIKNYVMKNNDMVKELLKGIKEDLEIKE